MVVFRCFVALILGGLGLLAQAAPRQSEPMAPPGPSTQQEAKKVTLSRPVHHYRSDQSMTGVDLPDRYQLTVEERARMREQLREQFQWVRAGAP